MPHYAPNEEDALRFCSFRRNTRENLSLLKYEILNIILKLFCHVWECYISPMWSKTGHSVFVENSTQTQNDSKPVAEFETKCAAACISLTLINRKQHSVQGTFVTFFWVISAQAVYSLSIQTKNLTMLCGEHSFIEHLYCTKWGRKDGSSCNHHVQWSTIHL